MHTPGKPQINWGKRSNTDVPDTVLLSVLSGPFYVVTPLLNDLATLTRNTLVTALAPEQPFTLTARPTPVQQKARDLLGLSRTQ